ncbi:MAG: phosphatidate cytidylyltransferase [Clostridia bacterium]|nr:phosphatidate cytidylyltransferase [Clostridia bacterium]
MNVKRVLTGVIGFPLVILLFVLANKYIIDVFMAVVACIAVHEYFKACHKEVRNLSWIGYVLSIGIALIHIVNTKIALMSLAILVPTILLILFLHIIISDMKINLKDIAFAALGIFYIISLIMFIPLIYGIGDTTKLDFLEEPSFADTVIKVYQNTIVSGKYLIWYLIFTSWGSDTFAYTVGRHWGKHKFSQVSPNKTIEGCLGGVFGAFLLSMIYTVIINQNLNFGISYWKIALSAIIFCIIGQIGDFAASTIKRYFDVKDYSNLFPGHGGMLDRIDSVMFIAPFAFCLFAFVL